MVCVGFLDKEDRNCSRFGVYPGSYMQKEMPFT